MMFNYDLGHIDLFAVSVIIVSGLNTALDGDLHALVKIFLTEFAVLAPCNTAYEVCFWLTVRLKSSINGQTV